MKDAIGDGNYETDVDNQPDDNYTYDEIGNLIKDVKEDIDKIEWTVYGKISRIYKGIGLSVGLQQITEYEYDAGGNRISKTVLPPDRGLARTTIYVRDAGGNVMAVYEKKPVTGPGETADLLQTEAHLYGSSRLGIYTLKRNMKNRVVVTDGIYTFIRGHKFFELSNHLGNVLVTVSDRKLQVQNTASPELIAYYAADVITAVDYYPGGMEMQGRKYELSVSSYRYSINGQEKTPEIAPNTTTAEFWQYDARIVRRWNNDPIFKEYESPYMAFGGNPIWFVDINGADTSVTDPGGGTTWLPTGTIIGADSKATPLSTGVVGEAAPGSKESFSIRGKVFAAKYDVETGCFAGYYSGDELYNVNFYLEFETAQNFYKLPNFFTGLNFNGAMVLANGSAEDVVAMYQLRLFESDMEKRNPVAQFVNGGVIFTKRMGSGIFGYDKNSITDMYGETPGASRGVDASVMFLADVGLMFTPVKGGGGGRSAARTGWKVGGPITNLTAKGNVPAWSTVRQRFWKNEAFLNGSIYSESNLLRMQKGLAPQRLNPNTGLMESMELHHHIVPQRNGGLFDFMKVWPDEHRALDPFRR